MWALRNRIIFFSWFYWETINIGWTPLDVLCPEPLNTKCYSSCASKRIFCHKLSFSKASSRSDRCQEPCQKKNIHEGRASLFHDDCCCSTNQYSYGRSTGKHQTLQDTTKTKAVREENTLMVLPVVRDGFIHDLVFLLEDACMQLRTAHQHILWRNMYFIYNIHFSSVSVSIGP